MNQHRLFFRSALAIIMTLFFLNLCKNINHFPIPNGDVFQYIYDGRQYVNFKLPSNIHPPPFAPFLICLVAKIFSHTEYPELFSAYTLNFVASTLILFNVFSLLEKKSPLLSLTTVFLLATNKIYFLTSLNLTNEIIYGYFLTLTLLLYQKKSFPVAYLLSGLLFLIRYESLVFPISLFVVEFFYHKTQFKIKNVFLTLTPIILWLIILNFHSYGTSILQNTYFFEISQGIHNIPNLNVFKSLIDIILFNPLINFTYPLFGYSQYNLFFSNHTYLVFTTIIFILFLTSFLKKKTSHTEKIIYLTLIFHLLFITVFPQFCLRYLTPLIWMIYFLIINRRHKKIKLLIIVLLVIFNLSQINHLSIHDVPDGFEYRYTADWLNQQNFSLPTRVLIYDPIIIDYYVNNDRVIIDFNSYEYDNVPNIYNQCQDDMACVVQKLYQKDLSFSQIYIVTTSYSSLPPENFSDQEAIKMHHLAAFRNFPSPQETSNYRLIDTIGDQQYWVKIYQYIPTKNPLETEGI